MYLGEPLSDSNATCAQAKANLIKASMDYGTLVARIAPSVQSSPAVIMKLTAKLPAAKAKVDLLKKKYDQCLHPQPPTQTETPDQKCGIAGQLCMKPTTSKTQSFDFDSFFQDHKKWFLYGGAGLAGLWLLSSLFSSHKAG